MKMLEWLNFRSVRKLPRNIWRFVSDNWRQVLGTTLFVAVVATLLGFRILGLTGHKLNMQEAALAHHLIVRDLGMRSILHYPIDLPYQLLIYLLEKLHISSPIGIRAISAAFGALTISAFYLILRTWHTRRVAILGTVMFATSAWTLHISRLGTPEVLLMLPMLLILCATWLDVSYWRKTILLLSLVTCMFLLYVPGMFIFVLAGAAWQAKRLYIELRQTELWFVICWLLLGLLLLVPLIWMIATSPDSLKALAGLPEHLPSIKQYALNVANIPVHLVARGPDDPSRWLGRIPLLDVFAGLMFVLGTYAYIFRFRLDRAKLIGAISLVGCLLIGLGGQTTISFLVPIVYIVIAGGITYMLQQWSSVFPRNPIARTLATTIMSIVVLLAAFYNLNHYFIAWPNTPETRQVYNGILLQ